MDRIAMAVSLAFGAVALSLGFLGYWRDRTVTAGEAVMLGFGVLLVGIPIYGDVALEAFGMKLHMKDRIAAELVRDPDGTAAMLQDVLETTSTGTPAVANAVASRGIIVAGTVDALARRHDEACRADTNSPACAALRSQLDAIATGIVRTTPPDVLRRAIALDPRMQRLQPPVPPSPG